MKRPLSVAFVSIFEGLLGGFIGFVGLMFLVDSFYSGIHAQWPRLGLSFCLAVLLGLIAGACAVAARALWRGLRWGWKASWAIVLLAMVPGMQTLRLSGHRTSGSTPAALSFLVPAVIALLALASRATRRFAVSAE